MRLILVLYTVYGILFAGVMVGIVYFPTHLIPNVIMMVAAMLYSNYLWDRRSPDLAAALMRRDLRVAGDLLMPCYFPGLSALVVGVLAALVPMFTMQPHKVTALTFAGVFVITFSWAFMYYNRSVADERRLPTLE